MMTKTSFPIKPEQSFMVLYKMNRLLTKDNLFIFRFYPPGLRFAHPGLCTFYPYRGNRLQFVNRSINTRTVETPTFFPVLFFLGYNAFSLIRYSAICTAFKAAPFFI